MEDDRLDPGRRQWRGHEDDALAPVELFREAPLPESVLLGASPAGELGYSRMLKAFPSVVAFPVGAIGLVVRLGVVPLLQLAREPPPEVAHVGHEGIVAVADPPEASVIVHLGPPRIEKVVPIRVRIEQRLRPGEQGGGERREAVLLIENGSEVADIEPPRKLPVGPGEVGVFVGEPGGREHGEVSRVETAHLLCRHADGRSGRDVLGTNAPPYEQGFEPRFVQAGH